MNIVQQRKERKRDRARLNKKEKKIKKPNALARYSNEIKTGKQSKKKTQTK